MTIAITTRYVGPTNHNGTRIVARSVNKRRVIPWDYTLTSEQNHNAAADTLIDDMYCVGGAFTVERAELPGPGAERVHVYTRKEG